MNYMFTDSFGTGHAFTVQQFPSNNCGFGTVLTGYATDATGYFIDLSRSAVFSPDGTRINFGKTNNLDANGNIVSINNGSIIDPNGNQIASTTYVQNSGTPNVTIGETDWTDTLGQTPLKIISQSNGPGGQVSEIDYARLAVDGTYQTIAVKYEFVSVQTAFGCAGITEFTSSSMRFVSEIDLPNGQKLALSYEPTPGVAGSVTGRLQQVTLPTGGTITYGYPSPNGGINCADGTLTQLTRTINNGASSSVWAYSRVPSGRGGATTMTAPQLPYDTAANQTVITFDPTSGVETSRKIYQGAATGNPARAINTSWSSLLLNNHNSPTGRTVILEDGSAQSEVETTYDANGLLQSSREHDWGAGAPGAILRTKTLTYLSGSAYAGVNIINRVKSETIADSSGAIKNRTDINYDEAGFVNATCVTGATQHDDSNFSCSYATRGLPTSVTTYTDAATPAGGVTKNFSYDSVGNLIAVQVGSVLQNSGIFLRLPNTPFPTRW